MRTRDYVAAAVLMALALGLFCTAFLLHRAQDRSLRNYVLDTSGGMYKLDADEAKIEGFCTVFYTNGRATAAACGQHYWGDVTEVK